LGTVSVDSPEGLRPHGNLTLRGPAGLSRSTQHSTSFRTLRKDDRDLNNVLSHAFQEMFIDGTTLGILKKYGLGERNLFAIKGMRSG